MHEDNFRLSFLPSAFENLLHLNSHLLDSWIKAGATPAEAETMFHNRVQRAEDVVLDTVEVPLSHTEYAVLVSFCFTVGEKVFLKSDTYKNIHKRKWGLHDERTKPISNDQ
jgi:GH24 family phage-related lysozyme (muramidase)